MLSSTLKSGALTAALLLTSSATLLAQNVTPMLAVGPQAVSANVAATSATGTNYGLFQCQVLASPVENCYDPYEIRTAYGVAPLIASGYDGRGKTVVIIDAYQSPRIAAELNFFNSFYGLAGMNGLGAPSNANLGTFTQIAPQGLTTFTPGTLQIGWAEEITLDVLYAHAMAPGANITLVLAKSSSNADILAATQYAVDNRLGDVISQSFGSNETCDSAAGLAQQHQIFAEATAKNMTIFASAGDSGSAQVSCDGTQYVQAVSSPASDPLVTAVGGTELHAADYTTSTPGAYQGEVAWNESALGAATGGGLSVVFDAPSYQKPALQGGKQRGVADVSYNAAIEHGVLLPISIPGVNAAGSYSFYLFGGTSSGSPQWAAITAIADQEAGRSLGFINTALYHAGNSPAHFLSAFNDVTSGNNSLHGVPGYSAGLGWDPPTGLGSPKAGGLADLLNQFVSQGDGTAIINQTKPHGNPNASGNGNVTPH